MKKTLWDDFEAGDQARLVKQVGIMKLKKSNPSKLAPEVVSDLKLSESRPICSLKSPQ